MRPDQVTSRLRKYEASMAGILSRSRESRDTLQIDDNDRPTFCQHGIEVADLLRDSLGAGHYSDMIYAELGDGLSNVSGSRSYRSASNILTIVRAALTRLENNPALLGSAKVEETMPVLRFAEYEPDASASNTLGREAPRLALQTSLSVVRHAKSRLLAWSKEMGSPFRHALATQSGKLIGGIALAATAVGLLHVIGFDLGSITEGLAPWLK
jgi:hypothetical protein